MASRLAGQCIALYIAEAERLCFSLISQDGTTDIYMYLAQNQLTEVTALGLLHLLRHLSDTVLVHVEMEVYLNWDLLQPDRLVFDDGSPSQFPRLKCLKLSLEEGMSAELIPNINRLFSHCSTVNLKGGLLPRLLDKLTAVSSGPGGVAMLEFYDSQLTAEEIDSVVHYFQKRELPNLHLLVPRIAFFVEDIPLEDWPSSCLPKETGETMSVCKCTKHQWSAYSFINGPSKKEFHVHLLGRRDAEKIEEFHLLF